MIDHQLHARSRPAARLSAADRRDLAQAWNVYPEDPAGSSATAARCLDKAREAGDSEIAAEALAVQAAIAIGGGDLKTGERLVDEARTAQASDPYLRPSTQIATVSALLAFQTGAFARAITEIARAIELADRSGDLDLRIQARRVACAVNGNLGLRGLRRPIEEVLSLTIAAGDKAEEAISRSDLATALWWDGELDKAEEQVERALALIEPLLDGHRISSAAILGTRGEIRLAAGRAEEGLADIETALERLERHASPNPYLLAEFTCSRLAALVELDRVDEARDVGSEILARLGDRVPQGRRRIMAQVAKALRESGHAEEAYDLLIDAAELQRLEFEELRSQLHDQAELDWLTGAYNRRFLDHQLAVLSVAGASVGLVFVDIDHFKEINDRHGHYVGDEVLVAIANLLSEQIDDDSWLIRRGGDEFLLLLSDDKARGAGDLAEHVRELVAEFDWSQISPNLAVTVSAGAVAAEACGDQGALLRLSERGLAAAKSGGRNQVATLDAHAA